MKLCPAPLGAVTLTSTSAPGRVRARSLSASIALALLTLAGCASGPGLPVVAQADSDLRPAVADPAPAAAAPASLPAATAATPPVMVAAPATSETVAATVLAVDPLDPTRPLDLDAAAARTDLWARVRIGLAVPNLNNDHVRKWEQWYGSRPDYVKRMTERGGRYLFHIVEEVNKRGLPTELALLPFIESAFNPQAMSSAKASGMWQFVPATGRDFSLRQNVFRDDRRDVLASTRAALDYLQGLHKMFGDWQLALAAYNWGQGSVSRAIAKNQRAGLPTDYSSLQMPDETRNYYPKLQAVKNIVLRPDVHGIALPALSNHPYFVSVAINRDIDVDMAARLAGLPLDEFKQLNPQMNKPLIMAAITPQVLLPYDNANRFVHAIGQHRGALATWTAWQAPRTLRPAEAALLTGMNEPQLREVNNIPKGMLVKAGSTLLVYRSAQRQADVAEQVAEQATLALAPDRPPGQRISFKAGRQGDSVVAVARRYHVSPQMVAQWNGTSANALFKPGQAVQVVVAAKAPKAGKAAKGTVRVAQAPKAGGGSAKRLNPPGPTARYR